MLFYNFIDSILPIASRIASAQQPILQDVSENDEEMQEFGYPPVSYGRLWQDKRNNYVAYSYTSAWKGAVLVYFETTDPSLSFAGGIHVGSTEQQLIKLFKNIYALDWDGKSLTFRIENGKVSKICYAAFEEGSGVPSRIIDIVQLRNEAAQR